MSPFAKKQSQVFIIFVVLLSISFVPCASESTHRSVGITFNNQGTTHPIVSLLKSLKINSVRLPDSDPELIRSFSDSKISLLLTIPNALIAQIASNQSEALVWIDNHVTPFHPAIHISSISVGNHPIEEREDLSDFLLSAMQNVRKALDELGIGKIKVSTTFSFVNVIATPFPPSSAQFKSDPDIPLGFALFREDPFYFREDGLTGFRYRNLYDMMVDSVFTAMASLGHENIPLIVTETGWPSVDEKKEKDSKGNDGVYAELYLKGLLRHLKLGLGTPLRRDGLAETYVYELVDDESNDSTHHRRHWGILYPNMTKKYDIDFSGSCRMFDISMMVLGIWLLSVILLWG